MREYWDRSQPMRSDVETPVDGMGVVAELVDEAIVGLESDGTVRTTNSRFRILTGRPDSALVGSPLSSVVVESDADRLAAVVRALGTQDHGEQTTVGVSLRIGSDEPVACQLSLAVVSGTTTARREADLEIVGSIRPIDTADAELKRRASQQAAVAALGQRAVESDDLDELMAEATQLVAETLDCSYAKVLELDVDREELELRQGVGWQPRTVGTATVDSNANSQASYTLSTEEPVIVDDLDSETRFTGPELLTTHDVTSGMSVIIGNLDAPWGILGVHDTRHRQFTADDANFVQNMATVLTSAIDRHYRTHELQRYEQIIETVTDGVYTVDPQHRFSMVNTAFCELSGYSRDELVGSETSLLVDEEVRAEVSGLEAEMLAEPESAPTIEGELRTKSGDTLVVEAKFAMRRTDHSWERVAVVRDVSERKAHEHQLKIKQTKLAALAEVNTVVREITDAVLEQSTRAEIEQLVCDALAAFDAYRFAWIGEVDPRTQEIVPHAKANTQGYLDEISISTDPDDPMSRGPAGRAVETQQLQVSQDVFTDPLFEPWRPIAKQWDYRSVAVIPITHDGTLYGILGLYSDEADAFSAEKQAIIEQLGEIIGHAIVSVERKQALMSDAVSELEVEIRDVFSAVDGLDSFDGEIRFDRAIPVGGDTYLQYGSAPTEMRPMLNQLEAESEVCESATVLAESETELSFELRLSEPPVTSVVASVGGSVTDAVIHDNDLRMTVHLPQTVDMRQVLNRIQEQYPTVRPVARRQVSRSETTSEAVTCTWIDSLTDRQRASLEAAYFSGYFEWPRDSSGQDLAAAMDISPATFHQHLRAAERKLFTLLLGDSETSSR